MHITPYKAMYFPNFIFLRKRLKSSHTSLKKLEKEDFNSINRYFISSLGDAMPPGEDASSSGKDAPPKKTNTHKKKPLSTNLLKEACKKVGGDLLSRGCAVPSARLGLTSLFGMGRGDPQRYNHQNIGWTTLFT